MTSFTSQEYFGERWLHELVYGTEKQLQLSDFESTLDGKKPAEVMAQKDEYINRESKLGGVFGQLQGLLSSEVMVGPAEIEDSGEIVCGSVKGFDLKKGTITVQTDMGLQTLSYCRIEPHEDYGRQINPTVTMVAEQEYTF